jgi:hypothetical protein
MKLIEFLYGKWETSVQEILLFEAKIVIDFKKDGKGFMTFKFSNRLVQAVWGAVDFKYLMEWGYNHEEPGTIKFEATGVSSYPTKVIDQILSTLRIRLSAEEFISKAYGGIFDLMGIGVGNSVPFIDNKDYTAKLGKLTIYQIN